MTVIVTERKIALMNKRLPLTCQYPVTEIFGDYYKKFWIFNERKKISLKCDGNIWGKFNQRAIIKGMKSEMFYVKDEMIHVNEEMREIFKTKYKGTVTCQIDEIKRTNDFNVFYKQIKKFELNSATSIQINETYINIKCGDPMQIYEQSLTVFHRKIRKDLSQTKSINIAIIACDSLSNLQFNRHGIKSREILENKFNTIQFNGINVVGDGTPSYLIPAFTGVWETTNDGYAINQLIRTKTKKFVDELLPTFVFRNFTQSNYVTRWREESFEIGCFTYRMNGFQTPLTDYFDQPYVIHKEKMAKESNCYQKQSLLENFFGTTLQFHKTFNKNELAPVLSFQMTKIIHGVSNLPSLTRWYDEELSKFLVKFHENSLHENTILILVGDHGNRLSSMRKTQEGKQEERNPYFLIHLPVSFEKKYKTIMKTLRENSEKLVTAFDVYATLHHLLQIHNNAEKNDTNLLTTWKQVHEKLSKKFKNSERFNSIFIPIPNNRTCTDSCIEPEWCNCLHWEDVTHSSKKIVQFGLQFINSLLDKHLCATYTLKHVMSVKKYSPSDTLLRHVGINEKGKVDTKIKIPTVYYQVTFILLPNDAAFEVTMKEINQKLSSTISSVTRVSLYGKSSDCMLGKQVELLPICTCKNFLL
ncbi:hypothetical protein SNEBB_000360 [Seison nebaliae]|nr:hypothetical protein SNEBB_000360 [Seison nebaliae]